jgi:putative flippase GtrA
VKTFVRWLRFNLVGAMGMVVQLAVLSVLNRIAPGHYLLASVIAVEMALVHNFFWHRRYTWRDRDGAGSFVRFQVTNGLVSVLGNIVLMEVLVGKAHLPVIVANFIAILGCSVVNFFLGDGWVFAIESAKATETAQAPRFHPKSNCGDFQKLLRDTPTERSS